MKKFFTEENIKKKFVTLKKIIMRFIFIALLTVITFLHANGQFYEDFSSGDFNTNDWQGMPDKFEISNSTAIPSAMRPALRTKDTVANTTFLCAPYDFTFTDTVEWTFWIKLSFSATSGNHARVYIVSDQLNITGALNGYFVGIGENNKKLTLVRQTGTNTVTIITGSYADLSSSTNVVRVKIIRYPSGEWKMYSDITGSTNWTLEGTGNDLTYNTSSWMGIYCKYTASNVNKIFFDEFYAGVVVPDTIPPTITNVEVVSQFQLNITFSEKVDSADVFNPNNYSVDNSVGNPYEVMQDALNPLIYYLSFFPNPFPDNTLCTLTVFNISDMADNMMDTSYFPFAYYVLKPYDIVINEIMADPTPVVGLPEYEYVELYNRTNYPINLNGWKMIFGSTVKTFSNIAIPGNSYLIVCGAGAQALSVYGQVHSFGSISVTNDGQTITLLDKFGRLMHSVTFTTAHYNDNNKNDGGWSLEMIDANNPCGELANWRASVNPFGGTPGTVNSVKANNFDLLAPNLKRISVVDNKTIRVWFSESMDSLKLLDSSAYSFSHGLSLDGNPQPVFPRYNSVILNLSQQMQQTVIYILTIKDTLTDCVGNIIPLQSHARFAISEPMEAGDVIINEVLSNPPVGLNEFVEIYNVSHKILDLKELNLANIDKNTGNVSSVKQTAPEGFIFFPGDHIVLTRNVQGILDYYYCPYPNNFIEMTSFPSYPNDNGNVVLIHNNNTVIDRLDYDVSMHFPLLQSTKGVSLERINYYRPTSDITNWHSASETAGFATPGYKNSQYSDIIFEGELDVYPEIFSPDNDGYNDILNISYSFSEPGNVASISIFDCRGRLVKNILTSELLGTSGVYSWDGRTNSNQKAGIGIYVILFEMFDINGNKKVYKKTAVLAGFLNR